MPHNRIFLSHKGVDKRIVRDYHDTLQAIGFSPWLDEQSVVAGSELVRSIQQGMKDSCAAVFFLTTNYDDREFLKAEVNYAIQEKLERQNGFALIALRLPDASGAVGEVPAVLKPYTYVQPRTDLEGLRKIVAALPKHLTKRRGNFSIPEVVPPGAKQVAVIGQNLGGRLRNPAGFKAELTQLFSRPELDIVVLVMMTPKALISIDPRAARHMRTISLPGLLKLRASFAAGELPHLSGRPDDLQIVFHPGATLSMLAVDWEFADRRFALITPKFQTTHEVDDRVNVFFDERDFEGNTLKNMLTAAIEGSEGSSMAGIQEAPDLMDRLLGDAGL